MPSEEFADGMSGQGEAVSPGGEPCDSLRGWADCSDDSNHESSLEESSSWSTAALIAARVEESEAPESDRLEEPEDCSAPACDREGRPS